MISIITLPRCSLHAAGSLVCQSYPHPRFFFRAPPLNIFGKIGYPPLNLTAVEASETTLAKEALSILMDSLSARRGLSRT